MVQRLGARYTEHKKRVKVNEVSVSKKVIIGAVAVLVVVIAASGTVLVLNHLKGDSGDNTQTVTPGNQDTNSNVDTPKDQATALEEAKSLEKKASDLLTTDRSAASEAYKNAAKAYKDAGVVDKAAQMEASAETSRPTVDSRQKAPSPNTTARGAAQ